MTTTAMIMTSGFGLIAVCGLLKWSFRAYKERRTYVVPDEQAYHTRTIRITSPMKKKNKRVNTDEL